MIFVAARIISIILSPFILIIPSVYGLILAATHNSQLAFLWGMATLFFSLLITGYLYLQVKRGTYSNFDVSMQTQRGRFFLSITLFFLIFLGIALLFHRSVLLITAILGVLVTIPTLWLVNRRIKASEHVATASAFAVILSIVGGGGFYYLSFVLVPLVAWSRLTLKRHTMTEVITGLIVGIVATLLAFSVLQYLMQ